MAADHGGFELKNILKEYLTQKGHEVTDLGTNSPESVDYPDYAVLCCNEVVGGKADFGILVCGTGVGISIAANKINGIRAALCADYFSTKYTRKHNDANVMCMGARTLGPGLASELAEIFLTTEFEGGRHQRRVDLITALENK